MKKHYRQENDCLNCGAELQGKFCHVCGQENLQLKENFGHMLNHAVSDYFHFDQHFFNTLKPLLFQPGKLTNEYMAGKRVRYLHPIKMYIFISLVYFLFLFNSHTEIVQIKSDPLTKTEIVKLDSVINTNTFLSAQQKEAELAKINKFKIVKKGNKIDTVYTGVNDDFITTGDTYDANYDQYLTRQQKLPPNKRDGLLTRFYYKKAFSWDKNGVDSKKAVEEAVQHNTPKMMFLLLPLFALLLKLTFWKSKKYYVEHLIYSFHFHCFLFLFLSIIILIQAIMPVSWDTNVGNVIRIGSFFIIMYYLYRSLRVVYNRPRGRTITKMIGLTISYITVFGIGMLLLILITAAFTV